MEDSVGPAEEEKGDEVVQENSDKSEQSTIAGVAQGVAEGILLFHYFLPLLIILF